MRTMCLFIGARAAVDAAGDEEDLALAKLDVTIAKLDRHATFEHEEEVVRPVVLVQASSPFTLTS